MLLADIHSRGLNAPARIFATHAPAYAAAGLSAFPVNTRDKRPAVRGWQKANPRKTTAWAGQQKLGDADGLGILMGTPSRIIEIDVDAVSTAWLYAAIERFGETPITIRTASGKAKLWYRHNGEGRHIRPFEGQPIDVLGSGFTIAPPSWREDLGAAYAFRTGGLDALSHLPKINPAALDNGFRQSAKDVTLGQRNESLWRYCMAEARHCDDVEALIDVAKTWASVLTEPLPANEVQRCARSAWGYEATGRNYLGLRKPQLSESDCVMDELLDEPEAYTLLKLFQRWHSNRSGFAIAPRKMSEAKSPPWSRQRIAKARDVLLERGFIEELSQPSKRYRRAGRYRLASRLPTSGHNHYTPSPSPPIS